MHGRLRVVGREQGSGLVRAYVVHASPHAPSGRPGGRVEKKSGAAAPKVKLKFLFRWGFGKGVGEILWKAANVPQNKLPRAQLPR